MDKVQKSNNSEEFPAFMEKESFIILFPTAENWTYLEPV
jgi:hypothetical protein